MRSGRRHGRSRTGHGEIARRTLLLSGAAAGTVFASKLVPPWIGELKADGLPPSPLTAPFLDPLPIPPIAQPVSVSALGSPLPTDIPGNTVFYNIQSRAAPHSFHRQLPQSVIWGYEGITPGPSIVGQAGTPILARFTNNLPSQDPLKIGLPINAIHRHGGFQSPEDDGYPEDWFGIGFSRDYLWLNPPEDGNLWYHDHSVDVTSQNVYRGLAAGFLNFDRLDSLLGELDPDPTALHLPGRMVGDARLYDVPLVIQDRQFNAKGTLTYDNFAWNGFVGDKFCVNGVIQPYFEVEPRKYRLRVLNGSNARQYELVLQDGSAFRSFDFVIGTDDRLLEHPIADVPSFRIASAERVQVVVDFSKYAGKKIQLVNILEQVEGRLPKGIALPGVPVMEFRVKPGKADDPSRVPPLLRPIPVAERPETVLAKGVSVRRRFEFGRSGGAWVINNQLYDENRIDARPVEDTHELWEFSSGGGWEHPVHVHLSNFFIVDRDGKQPPLLERGWKDAVVVGGNRGAATVLVKFSGFTGKYVFHCHSVEHEDNRMMTNFEVVPKPAKA